MNAIDTNILVYVYDSHEPSKQSQAASLVDELMLAAQPTILLWQVLVEFSACLTRWCDVKRITRPDAEVCLAAMREVFPLMLPTEHVFDRSRTLLDRYSNSYWDSLLIAACVEANVETIYSEDLSGGMVYEGVQVVNPFH